MQTKTHRHVLPLEPISAAAFAPFGQVIEAGGGAAPVPINDGFAQRFDGNAVVDTAQGHGATRVSIYRSRLRVLPIKLSVVERQLLGFRSLTSAMCLAQTLAMGHAFAERQRRGATEATALDDIDC